MALRAVACGIDNVDIARIERLLRETPSEDLVKLFTERELADAGDRGDRRAESLAARFAAKEACLKLFPRAAALNTIAATDFSVDRGPYGEPVVRVSPAASEVMRRNGIAEIRVSLTHTSLVASAVALAMAE